MSEFTDATPTSPGATMGIHPEQLPSRGNPVLLNEIPVATREWWTMQLLGNPEDPDDRGSIEQYMGTRNRLVRDSTITPEQATLVNKLPEIQNAAVQLLLGELHPEESGWKRFNPAFEYSGMSDRLVASGIITDPEAFNRNTVIRKAVALLIETASSDAKRRNFLIQEFAKAGILSEDGDS